MSKSTPVSTPQTNLATVQRLYSAFAKHDIATILSLLRPDIEWGEPQNPFDPAGGTRRGHAGFLEWVNIGREAEDILVLEPRKFLLDADSVAVVGYTKILVKPTKKTYETDFVHLISFKNGKVFKFQEFFDTYIAGEAFRQ
jgi:uncharacterized protein